MCVSSLKGWYCFRAWGGILAGFESEYDDLGGIGEHPGTFSDRAFLPSAVQRYHLEDCRWHLVCMGSREYE